MTKISVGITTQFLIKLNVIYKESNYYFMTPEAEKFNGWMAMLGIVAAFGAYATTGQIIPGIF